MSCAVRKCPNGGSLTREADISYHTFPHPLNEKFRHDIWIAFCDNPSLRTKHPLTIYKTKRICRRHFAKDSLNGDCKRILKDALPTLHWNGREQFNNNGSTKLVQYPSLTKCASNDREKATDEFQLYEVEDPEENCIIVNESNSMKHYRLHLKTDDDDENVVDTEVEEQLTPPNVLNVEYHVPSFCDPSDSEDIHEKESLQYVVRKVINRENVGLPENSTSRSKRIVAPKINKTYSGKSRNLRKRLYPVSTNVSQPVVKRRRSISDEKLKKWRSNFYADQKNVLAQNVCSRVDPFEACLSRKTFENTQHVFTYKVESEGKPLTNQKSSGRCWIFATLNCLRIPFMKSLNLDEFEFSQGYLFYWDKIERCHYFLNNIVETANRGEKVDGRLVSFLLSDPTCDGGQWDMIVNLIKKHGLIPKKCFPESYSCEASLRMNAVLKSKLREYAKILRDLIEAGADEEKVNAKIDEQMGEIYNVVGICLGIPSEEFTWEYYDKSKAYHSVGPITPVEFYEKHVKPVYNVDDKVCLVTDPRPTNSYGKAYTVDCLGNVVGGRPVLYNNQPVELLMDLVGKSLKNGEPVWFGCEVSKRFAGKQGIEDLTIHDFKLVFGVDIQTTISKADRLLYGESAMTHAMAFTAVSYDKDGKPSKFRVENSWGEDRGEKGYLIMSADWFKEFVFEVVIDKSLVPDSVMEVFKVVPIVLPAWDPMGTLAK